MNTIHPHFMLDKLAYLADIKRSKLSLSLLFGYSGIYYETVLFGALYKNELYLKKVQPIIDLIKTKLIQSEAIEFLTLNQGIMCKKLDYVKVPEQLQNDPSLFVQLIHLAIDLNQQDRTKEKRDHAQKLRSLPNITFSLERSLYKIGIQTTEQLKKIGVFEIFYLLEKENKALSCNILFHLHGAFLQINSLGLSSVEKQKLLTLYQAFKAQKQLKLA